MKIVFAVLALVVVVKSEGSHHDLHPLDDLKCNFRVCGAELLNFHHFGVSSIFRKIEVGNFCIKNCTPPVIHEFFQSIVFAITQRIPHHCHGDGCADKNRFVALAKCAKERAWPLVLCSKTLIDLAQIGLVDEADHKKRNITCRIVVDTTQCIEEQLQVCGEQPFSLVKEIFGDVINKGINSFCHPAFSRDNFIPLSSTYPPFQERMKHFTDIPPKPGKHPYPQFVKGYRHGGASMNSLGIFTIFASLLAGLLVLHFK